jgi:hypothetical protein
MAAMMIKRGRGGGREMGTGRKGRMERKGGKEGKGGGERQRGRRGEGEKRRGVRPNSLGKDGTVVATHAAIYNGPAHC